MGVTTLGVNLSGSVPGDPSGPVSWLDTIASSAGSLGDGLAAGFVGLLNGIGSVLTGAVQAVGSVFSVIADGVGTMLGWIGHAIGSIFGGSAPKPNPLEPMPTIFNPIKTNLEETLEPYFDKVDDSLAQSVILSEDISNINANLESQTGVIEGLNDQLAAGLDPDNPDSPLWNLQIDINENNALFQAQQIAINDLQNERDDLQDKAVEALRMAQEAMLQTIVRTIYIPRNTPVSDPYFEIRSTTDANAWRILARSGWVGFFTFQTVRDSAANPGIDGFKVADTRTWTLTAFQRHQSILSYWVQPGEPKVLDQELDYHYHVVDQSYWESLPGLGFTAPVDDGYSLYFRVGWEAANNWDGHGIRILKNGVEILRKGVATIGPLVGDGYRTQTINVDNFPLKAGDVISFQAYAAGSNWANREIWDAWVKAAWVEPADAGDIQIGD